MVSDISSDGRILINSLIRDADTAGQVKTQLDVIHGIIAEESEQSHCEQQDQQAEKAFYFAVLHLISPFILRRQEPP